MWIFLVWHLWAFSTFGNMAFCRKPQQHLDRIMQTMTQVRQAPIATPFLTGQNGTSPTEWMQNNDYRFVRRKSKVNSNSTTKQTQKKTTTFWLSSNCGSMIWSTMAGQCSTLNPQPLLLLPGIRASKFHTRTCLANSESGPNDVQYSIHLFFWGVLFLVTCFFFQVSLWLVTFEDTQTPREKASMMWMTPTIW